jgi:hypothetical protein
MLVLGARGEAPQASRVLARNGQNSNATGSTFILSRSVEIELGSVGLSGAFYWVDIRVDDLNIEFLSLGVKLSSAADRTDVWPLSNAPQLRPTADERVQRCGRARGTMD